MYNLLQKLNLLSCIRSEQKEKKTKIRLLFAIKADKENEFLKQTQIPISSRLKIKIIPNRVHFVLNNSFRSLVILKITKIKKFSRSLIA